MSESINSDTPPKPPISRNQGRTPLGFLWRLGVIVAVLAGACYAYLHYTGVDRKIERLVREDAERQTGRPATVHVKKISRNYYSGTVAYENGDVLDVDAVVYGNDLGLRTMAQRPVIEKHVRDAITQLGFEPKTVTLSKNAVGTYSGTADATTGERFRIYEKESISFSGPVHLGPFTVKSEIMVELVP